MRPDLFVTARTKLFRVAMRIDGASVPPARGAVAPSASGGASPEK